MVFTEVVGAVVKVFLTCWITVFFLLATAGGGLRAEDLLGGIISRLSEEDREDVEQSFRQAYQDYKDGEWSTAADNFFQITVDFPESKRARDSLFFLRKLQPEGYYPASRSPLITVLLRDSQEVRGTALSRLNLVGEEGETLVSGSSRAPWSAEISGGKVILELDEKKFTGNRFILLGKPGEVGPVVRFNGVDYRGELILEAGDRTVEVFNRLPINQYLYGVVKKETAPGWPDEALKAQAVASRSFVINSVWKNREKSYDIGDDISGQLYEGYTAETARGRRAVDETLGEVLVYNGAVIPAYFHSNSGGHIEDGSHIWAGNGYEFIEARPDSWSLGIRYSEWEAEFERNQLNRRLARNLLPEIADLRSFKTAEKLDSGRAVRFSYRTNRRERVWVNANRFRMAVGGNSMLSTWIEQIETDRRRIKFIGRGWGHGVGKSQWGARTMAEAGHDYKEILDFYYSPTGLQGDYGRGVIFEKQLFEDVE